MKYHHHHNNIPKNKYSQLALLLQRMEKYLKRLQYFLKVTVKESSIFYKDGLDTFELLTEPLGKYSKFYQGWT